tara:strand:+ start:2790 stop:3284 length:495 start_codon:yes stop_codon:yes gene_type:complete
MAVFNKNSLYQVSGFNNPIISGELVWNQQTYWNLVFTNSSTSASVDLTGATIDASITRRLITNLTDTRNGLTFDVEDYPGAATIYQLGIVNRNDATGAFTVTISDSTWGLIATDPELNIAINDCVGFSGRIKISFPAAGGTPADDSIIFLLFLVRSDGIIQENS